MPATAAGVLIVVCTGLGLRFDGVLLECPK
jgi:hypothetical protein